MMTLRLTFTMALVLLAVIHETWCLEPRTRIIGGESATTDEYPWMVSIQTTYSSVDQRVHYCSGSLIRTAFPAAVLTAGHCVGEQVVASYGPTYYGDIDRTYPHDDSDDGHVTLRAFYYRTFEEYEQQHSNSMVNLLTDYDVGILLLDGSVDDIDPITLYNANHSEHLSRCCDGNETLRALGYGFIDGDNEQTDTLRFLDMEYVPDLYECSDAVIECVDPTASYYDIVVDDGSAICAQRTDAGICQGDSGGPLVHIDDEGDVVQIAIGSQSCCEPGVPNMFATIEYFYDEIQEVLADDSTWRPFLNYTQFRDEVLAEDKESIISDSGDVVQMLLGAVIGAVAVSFVVLSVRCLMNRKKAGTKEEAQTPKGRKVHVPQKSPGSTADVGSI